MLNTYRNWILLLIQILIPVSFIAISKYYFISLRSELRLFFILAIIIVKSWGGNKDLPPLSLDLDTYQITVTTLETNPAIEESDIFYK